MYTGTVISELMEMVARVQDRAHDAGERDSEDQLLASHFAYSTADVQSMMVGVA